MLGRYQQLTQWQEDTQTWQGIEHLSFLREVEIFLFRENLVTHLLISFGKKYSGTEDK